MALFHTTEKSLPKAIADLTATQLRSLVGSTIFQRGESYYSSGAVEDIAYTDRLTLEATVGGSEFYGVIISLGGDGVETECDCPYDGGTCKHVVAVLLEAMREGDSIRDYPEEDNESSGKTGVLPLQSLGNGGTPPEASKEFQAYVESLSLKELQELVLRYAPEDFRRTVLTRALNETDAEKVMKAAERAIEQLFQNDYLRHDNGKLERELMRQCGRVRGLWEMLPERVGAMLVDIITTIDEGFEEGDFYDYDDYDGEGFASDEFDEYVVQFLRSIPVSKKSPIVAQIQDALGTTGYGAFGNIEKRKAEWFTPEELPALKQTILQAIRTKKYGGNAELDYKTISPILDDAERELLLLASYINSSTLTLELVGLYRRQDKAAEALTIVDNFIQKPSGKYWSMFGSGAILLCRLELASVIQEPPTAYLKSATQLLQAYPKAELLQAASEYLGAGAEPLETLLRKQNPEEFFHYLDKQERWKECWAMVHAKSLRSGTEYLFAVNRLRSEPENAKEVLLRHIETQKKIADNDAYSQVTEALKHLQTIDTVKTQEILLDLRTNYKRRTNLMKLLNMYFRP
ncbi:MAG: SWIM zinc finger family protein [Ignavibacteria bacterium]|nr:SWIM zinc finger family protein [Ignavibacteria bacterium]